MIGCAGGFLRTLRSRPGWRRWYFHACMAVCVVTPLVILLRYSWTTDLQYQGRYLLPIALSTCYLGSRARGLWEKRAFCLTVLTAACISLLFFGLVETRTLIDLGYVRELLRL